MLCNLLIPYFQVYSFEILSVAIGAIGLFSQIQEQNAHLKQILKIFFKDFGYLCVY